jgi:hypothetical protein
MRRRFHGVLLLAASFWMVVISDCLAQNCGSDYTIKEDESLADISRRVYGSPSQWIAALYAFGDLMQYSGRALIGAELGPKLGVTDIDGSAPLSLRYTMGGPPELHASLR